MRPVGRVALWLAVWAVAGCGRPGPVFTPSFPKPVAELYQRAEQSPSAAVFRAIGQAQAVRRDWPRAVTAYEQVLAQQPDDLMALVERAGLRMLHGDRDQAEELANRIERLHGENATAQAALGQLYVGLGRGELALASFRKAVRLDPRSPVALLRLGEYALARGKLGEAAGYRDRLLAAAGKWPPALSFRLKVAQASGNTAEVERLLRQAWEQTGSPEARALLTVLYLLNDRAGQALALNDEWLKKHPTDAAALVARSESLDQLGRGKEALRSLRTALESGNHDPRLHLAYGRLLFQAKRVDEAVTQLREAVDRAPVDSGLQMRAADLLAENEQRAEAFAIYQRIAQDNPRLRPDIARRLGLLAQQSGLKQGEDLLKVVEPNYLMALMANPRDVVVLNNLAYQYAESEQKLEVAQQLIDQAIKLRGPEANLLDTRGWVEFKRGKLDAAAKDLAAAVKADPGDALAHYHRARLLEAKGDRAGALAAARRALALDPAFLGYQECQELVARLKGKP